MFNELFQNTPTIYPIIGFVLFFLFYLGVIFWTFRTKKEFRDKMKQLPLDSRISNGEKKNG